MFSTARGKHSLLLSDWQSPACDVVRCLYLGSVCFLRFLSVQPQRGNGIWTWSDAPLQVIIFSVGLEGKFGWVPFRSFEYSTNRRK